jgi:hypothetical protein
MPRHRFGTDTDDEPDFESYRALTHGDPSMDGATGVTHGGAHCAVEFRTIRK